MRAPAFLFSAAVFLVSLIFAAHLAHLRYDADAQRAMGGAVVLAGTGCLIALACVRFLLPRAAPFIKLITYFILSLAAAAVVVVHQIGRDGILPARDGSQSVGLHALIANGDLFLLIILATAFAGRNVFRRL